MRALRRLFGGRPRARTINRVAPWLIVGPALEEGQWRTLPDEGVTHVVDLREESSDDPELMRELGIQWFRLEIPDLEPPTDEQLHELIAWLEDSMGENDTLYLHCQGGLHRTPTVAIALLVHRGMGLAPSHRLLVSVRPGAFPTEVQQQWLSDLPARLGR